jgi:hypothetical protein
MLKTKEGKKIKRNLWEKDLSENAIGCIMKKKNKIFVLNI